MEPPRPWSIRPWLVALPLGLAALAAFFAAHAGYYLAPLVRQALDPRHGLLRSSGRVGLLFGVAGMVLILLNLTYLLRRRVIRWRWPGSLRAWMDLHVVSGLLGATCVLLHACLGLRSALGTAAAGTLAIVVAAGVIGRYLYAHVPRSLEGRELRLDEVRAQFEHLLGYLRNLGIELAVAPARPRPASRLQTFFTVIFGDRELKRQYREKRRHLLTNGLDARARAQVLPLLRRLFRERQGIQRYRELRDLMASWRFLHRWLALVMIGTLVFHVTLAVLYGNLWILGARP